jgi:hypothetical protein
MVDVVAVVVVVELVSVVVPGSSARAAGAARDESASVSKSPRASNDLLMQYPFVVYGTAVACAGDSKGETQERPQRRQARGSCLSEAA